MQVFKTMKEATVTVGGLSEPGKMPGFAYSIPPSLCKTGAKLRKVKGTVCNKCYAMKGMYRFKCVTDAMQRRFNSLSDPLWIPAMTQVLQGKYDNYLKRLEAGRDARDCGYFRVHDAGDIQDFKHLLMWVSVARQVKDVKFWIPTHERGILHEFVNAGHVVPLNMVIRISAPVVGKAPAYWKEPVAGIQYSAVALEGDDVDQCLAYTRGGHCDVCRDCWDRDIKVISYPLH